VLPISVSRPAALVLASLVLVVLVLAGNRLAQGGTASASEPNPVAPLEQVSAGVIETAPSRSGSLVVHVVGAVRRPGLLRLREGARVADAVARAGGVTRRADLAAVNLAAPLVDGVQILVPARASTAAAGVPAPASEAATGLGRKPSLAAATAEELDALPGVGPVTAQKILDYRTAHGPFRSVEDLDAVPGIGPARIEQLRDLVTP
jgi:competence protein ComEA